MKGKFLNKMIMVALVFCSMFLISACSWQKDINIKTIEVNEETIPTIIRAGEFDDAGIELIITYEDDSVETISVTSDMISEKHQECLTTPGIYDVEIYFKSEKATLTVTIVEPELYMVEFYNGREQLLERQFITKGNDAVSPAESVYAMTGYDFVGWDRLFTNVTEDIKVYGVYSKLTTEDMNALVHEKMVNALTYASSHNYVMSVPSAGGELVYHYDEETQERESQAYSYEGEDDALSFMETFTTTDAREFDFDATTEKWNITTHDITETCETEEEKIAYVMFGGEVLNILFNESTTYTYSYQLTASRNLYTVEAVYSESDYSEKLVLTFDDEKILSVDSICIYDEETETITETIEMLFDYKTENFMLFGDANQDGVVDSEDGPTILRWTMKEVVLNSLQELIADVNCDGVIDINDSFYVQWYVDGKIPSLPFTDKFGDVNFDDVVDNLDVLAIVSLINGDEEMTASQRIVADVNLDGIIDAFDAWLIRKYCTGEVESLPCTCICGDVNSDGEINSSDSELLSQYLNQEADLTDLGLVCADVNLDGSIDSSDLTLLQQYINGEIDSFPYEIAEE